MHINYLKFTYSNLLSPYLIISNFIYEKIIHILMAEEDITVKKCTCERCGHIWITRGKESPVVCPKCKSAYWNKPRIGDKKNI